MNSFSLVVAMDKDSGIGRAGQLPWHLSADLKRFRAITTDEYKPNTENVVVMGRKTWDSLPPKYKPLPRRINVVLSHNQDLNLPEGVVLINNLRDLKSALSRKKLAYGAFFVIGGQQIYTEALRLPECKKIYVTHINGSFDCDTFFPPFLDQFQQSSSEPIQMEDDLQFFFAIYTRVAKITHAQ